MRAQSMPLAQRGEGSTAVTGWHSTSSAPHVHHFFIARTLIQSITNTSQPENRGERSEGRKSLCRPHLLDGLGRLARLPRAHAHGQVRVIEHQRAQRQLVQEPGVLRWRTTGSTCNSSVSALSQQQQQHALAPDLEHWAAHAQSCPSRDPRAVPAGCLRSCTAPRGARRARAK